MNKTPLIMFVHSVLPATILYAGTEDINTSRITVTSCSLVSANNSAAGLKIGSFINFETDPINNNLQSNSTCLNQIKTKPLLTTRLKTLLVNGKILDKKTIN